MLLIVIVLFVGYSIFLQRLLQLCTTLSQLSTLDFFSSTFPLWVNAGAQFHLAFFNIILGLQCPRLSDPRNGNVTYAYGYAGETAVYNCYHGYKLIGMSSRVCEESEKWSGSQPQCSRKLIGYDVN